MTAIVLWGNQLLTDHHSALQAYPDAPVIIIENKKSCQKYKYHKQKILFVLTAMREYGDELRAAGRTVWYHEMNESNESWFDVLTTICAEHNVDQVAAMRQNDRTPQQRLEAWAKEQNVQLSITPNIMFLTPTALFNEWADGQKRYQMEQFYRWQRRRLNILMTDDAKPVGGKWNYDSENRKPLPKIITIPQIALPEESSHAAAIKQIIDNHFDDHPGSYEINWLPTSRKAAQHWLKDSISQRFENFGDYEDAMRPGETFLFHSGMSALLNIGLLHPTEVIDAALQAPDISLSTKEGFIRQIIGWREFIFGMYHFKPADWIDSNVLRHKEPLPKWWWTLSDAPEPPLQDVISRLHTYGYSHHIERLMILGNYMLLANYHPKEVYTWFMTMYVDAYEWVMVPNVIGMSQYADGGMDNKGFATKPYISGSNYLQKMGKWWPSTAAAKESEWTPMYWEFLLKHRDTLETNHRIRPLYSRFKK